MTIRFLADENFDHKTLAGLKRRDPDFDIVAVQEVGLRQAVDPDVPGVGGSGASHRGHP